MPLNPNISLAVRGIELQDPLAQYSKVAAIQGAQSQNQLAQMKMQEAQREQASTNALNRAYQEAYNSQTGEVDVNKLRGSLATGGFGSKLPAIEKGLVELGTARTAQQKGQVELLDSKLKQSRQFLENIDPSSPGAAEAYMQWHKANHADPVIGKALEARGITVDQSMARIQQLLQTPGGLNRLINESKLGTEKFMEMNKPTTQVIDEGNQRRVIQTPGLGGTPTTVGTYATSMSPYESARLAQQIAKDKADAAQGVTYQQDANGNIIALPTKLLPGQIPEGRTAMAPGSVGANGQAGTAGQGATQPTPLQAKPSETEKKEMVSLNQQRSQIKGALDAVRKSPNAFGFGRGLQGSTVMGESIAGRFDTPEESTARSYVYNIISSIIKERAGTAQSAAELAVLNKFLPGQYDNDTQVKSKLEAFDDYLSAREEGTTSKRPDATQGKILPQAAVDALLAGQGTDAQFDEIFGAGAAARARKAR